MKGPVIKLGKTGCVKVYSIRCRGTYPYYQVNYYANGKRYRISRTTLEAATSLGNDIAESLESTLASAEALSVNPRDWPSIRQALHLLRPSETPLLTAVSRYTQSVKLLGNPELLPVAALFYAENVLGKHCPDLTVAEVFAELIADRSAEGYKPSYARGLRAKLSKFVSRFGRTKLLDLANAEIEAFIAGLTCGQRSKTDMRREISMFIRFSRQRGYLPPMLVARPTRVLERLRKEPAPLIPKALSPFEKTFFQMAAAGALIVDASRAGTQ